MLALHHALRTVRERPDQLELTRAAIRRCREALAAALRHGPLRITLHDGALAVCGATVLRFAAEDVPFGALSAAGIGELVVAPQLPAEAVAELVQRLAAVRCENDPETTVATALGPAARPFVQLRAASASGAVGSAPGHAADWWLLPPPAAAARALRPLVERDLAANLPALAAAQLLLDLDRQPPPPDAVLQGLFDRLLHDRELGTAAWLLGAVDRQPNVPATARARLRQTAETVTGDDWLRRALSEAADDELLDLASFVIELGTDAAARCAHLAEQVAHPRARWLGELLGQ